jgi:hypothetical protein
MSKRPETRYKLIRTVYDLPDKKKGNLYAVHEVYIDENGKPTGSFPVGPAAETVKELRNEMRQLMRALDSKPSKLEDIIPKWEPIEVPEDSLEDTLEAMDE